MKLCPQVNFFIPSRVPQIPAFVTGMYSLFSNATQPRSALKDRPLPPLLSCHQTGHEEPPLSRSKAVHLESSPSPREGRGRGRAGVAPRAPCHSPNAGLRGAARAARRRQVLSRLHRVLPHGLPGAVCAPSLSPLQTRYMAGSVRRSREAPGPDVSVPASPWQLLPGLRVRPLPALYRQLLVSGVSVALPAPGAPELTPHWRLRGYLDGFEAHPPGGPLGAGAPGRSASCRDLKAPLLEAVPGLHSSPCPRNGSTAPRVCRAPSQHPPLCLRAKWTAVCSSSKFKN